MRKRPARRSAHAVQHHDVPADKATRRVVLTSGAAVAFTAMGGFSFFILSSDAWKIAAVFGALGLILAAVCLRTRHAAARRSFLWGVAAAAVVVLVIAFIMRQWS